MTSILMNAVQDMTSGVSWIGKDVKCQLKMVKNHKAADSLAKNSVSNLDAASKGCSVIGGCKNMVKGIAQGDYEQAVANGGLLSLYTVTAGGVASNASVKMASAASKGTIAAQLGAISTLSNSVGNSGQ